MRSLIGCSIVFTLLLSIVPLPFELRRWRPEFMALLVVYWVTYRPDQFGVATAWVSGILLDIIGLSPLGHHSISLVAIAYISHLVYQRIRSYSLWQQVIWMSVLMSIYKIFCNWISSLMDQKIENSALLIGAISSALLWPLMVILFRKIKLYFCLI